jgi:hypothetical protein
LLGGRQRWRIEKIDFEVGVFGWAFALCSRLDALEEGQQQQEEKKIWELAVRLPVGKKDLKRGAILETLELPTFTVEWAEKEFLSLTEQFLVNVH